MRNFTAADSVHLHSDVDAQRHLAGHPCEPLVTTTVILGAASPALLYGLEAMVTASDDLQLVGSAQNLDDFLRLCTQTHNAVALVDPALANLSVSAFMAHCRSIAPSLRILLLTDAQQPNVVREAVRSGVSGLVHKTADATTMRMAMVAASKGHRYLSSAAAADLAESLSFDDLTRREMDVLQLLSKGKCNKIIARELNVALGTVKTHMRAISNKFGSASRTEVVLKAYRMGLVDLNH